MLDSSFKMAAPLLRGVGCTCQGLLHCGSQLSAHALRRSHRVLQCHLLSPNSKPSYHPSAHQSTENSLADDQTLGINSEYFRTRQNNPLHHTIKDEGLFYTIPKEEVKTVFPAGYSTRWERLIKPFNEAAMMVRRPALEVIDYIRQTNFDQLAIKYVIYGRKGSGKTMTLNHIIHHCQAAGWLIVHIPTANGLNLKNKYDFIDSVSHEGMYDQPTSSTDWLKQFKLRNERFLKELKTTEKYVWNKRESTEKDQPLLSVLEQGLTRPKNATDVIGVLLKELQLQSYNKQFKMLYAIKAVNGLFAEETAFRKHGGYIIPVRELTLHMHFRNFLKGDWINGSIVTTVDYNLSYRQPKFYYTPFYLLGKKGFDHMDPFIPVFVDEYSDKEFESQIAYYQNKHWIQDEEANTEAGKLYLKKLSDMNPAELDKLVSWI